MPRIRDVTSTWWRLGGPVDRTTYILSGLLLISLKYVVEAAALAATGGGFLTVPGFIDPVLTQHAARFEAGAPWLPWAVLLWTLPFIWIGTQLSCRRAVSAGASAWIGVLFLVPYLNWWLMVYLMAAPPAPPRRPRAFAANRRPLGPDIARSLVIALGVAGCMLALCVYELRSYGSALFVVTPVIMGVVIGAIMRRGGHSHTAATLTGQAALLLALAGLIAVSLEGVACVIMAWPLAAALVLIGTGIGGMVCASPEESERGGGGVGGGVGGSSALLLALLALPLIAWNDSERAAPAIREVASVVEIDAPPETVWRNVVSFPDLPPPDGIFATGIACPLRAVIDGAGVGAIRRCEFTTGPFIEPITTWDEPRRLGFSVIAQPPAMREWSPYGDVRAPHLDGFLTCLRGEFRLVALPGGRTRLEGSSWYQVDVHPEAYWGLWSDGFIHAIHRRVLEHIKRLSERAEPIR